MSVRRQLLAFGFAFLLWPLGLVQAQDGRRPMPWRAAGLDEYQAAAHLLDRFSFGARPGDVEAVVEVGFRNWFEGQLAGDLPGAALSSQLQRLPAASLPHQEILRRYTAHGDLVEEAIRRGVIIAEQYDGKLGPAQQRMAADALMDFVRQQGDGDLKDLVRQLRAQKILRALHSDSQVVEVLTDFWFNHFNVPTAQVHSVPHLMSFERDAIRPHVLLRFSELLTATAHHPAMLVYLNNSQSLAEPRRTTSFDLVMEGFEDFSPADDPTQQTVLANRLGWRGARVRALEVAADPERPWPGLNENYARELLELHTLGVDGGYTQTDIIELARILTGWTTLPGGRGGARLRKIFDDEQARRSGFLLSGEYLFRADFHDAESKVLLGRTYPEGRGYEEGLEVLDALSVHTSTAWHLSYKLAVKFVADQPPRRLVARLAESWELSRGDLRQVLRTLVEDPDFWSSSSQLSKVRSPFEMVIAALRASNSEVRDEYALVRWLSLMGQPLYNYPAPTGHPDRESAWTDAGSLLARMNFGLLLAEGKMPGVTTDLLELIGNRPVTSVEEALEELLPVLMPERDGTPFFDAVKDLAAEEPPTDPAGRARWLRYLLARAAALIWASPDFQRR